MSNPTSRPIPTSPHDQSTHASTQRVKSPDHDIPLTLIGDIGATNTRLALARGAQRFCQHSYLTGELCSVDQLLQRFFNEEIPAKLRDQVDIACFGVAGPIIEGSAHLTNAGWSLSELEIMAWINAPALLVNDFYAQAMAMPHLGTEALAHVCGPKQLTPGMGRSIAVLGAGSGLGEAILVSSHTRPYPHAMSRPNPRAPESSAPEWIVVATEGGHTRFAPRNEVEVGLNLWLRDKYGAHVSVERVVSGSGVVDLFRYFLGERPLSALYTEPVDGAQVSRAALMHHDPIALKALTHFIEIYADEAANLALKSNAEVIFLSGGITPKLLPLIQERFPSVFVDKGRYRDLLTRSSVWVVTADDPGLRGAQATAERLFQSL